MPEKAVLIYDGQCPVCRRAVGWIRENAKKGAFRMLSCQSEEVKKKYPFIKEDLCMRAMQLVLPDGKVLSGEKALPEIVKRLRRYSGVAGIFALPGSEALSRAFYRWFADRRYHIAEVLFPRNGQDGRKGKGKPSSSSLKG
jgi:predicted DCC family thiol-disulfide oxidoreductase YuxK